MGVPVWVGASASEGMRVGVLVKAGVLVEVGVAVSVGVGVCMEIKSNWFSACI